MSSSVTPVLPRGAWRRNSRVFARGGRLLPRSWRRPFFAILLLVLVLYVGLVPLLNTVPLTDVSYQTGAQAPSLAHLFGTDLAGRDLFVRCAYGLRVSILVALAGALSWDRWWDWCAVWSEAVSTVG